MRVRPSRCLRCATALLVTLAWPVAALASTAYTELRVEGLKSAVDSVRVTAALAKVPGVLKAEVGLAEGRAFIQLDGESIPSQASLIQAIEAAGFQAASTVGRKYQEFEASGAVRPETLAVETVPATPAAVQPLSKTAVELRELFNDDADKLRLVLLLSPS